MPKNSIASVANNIPATGGVTGKGFLPGQSGNPNGRPKGLARSAREVVGEDGRALVAFWFSVLDDPDAKMTDRLEASKLLAERGWGKAASFAPIEEDDPLGLTGARDRLAGKLARVTPLPQRS